MLNDTLIRSAKPRERDYKLSDFDGLYLLVCSNGSRLWRFAYRFDGKQKQIALGAYPQVTLADARDHREASRKLLANRKDPSVERRLEKIARQAGGNTFREVAEELLDKQRREERSEATLRKKRWLLEPAYAAFGDRPVSEVTAPELLHALRKFELRGRYESARRLRAVAGMIFRYAIATGRASRDISVDLRGALTTPKVKHRAAITEPKDLGALLRAIEGYNGQPTTRLALAAFRAVVRPAGRATICALGRIRLREGGLDRAGRHHEDEAAASGAAGAPGHRDPARALRHHRAGRIPVSGGFVGSPTHERQHLECRIAPAWLHKGGSQRVRLPRHRLDPAQRDGPVES